MTLVIGIVAGICLIIWGILDGGNLGEYYSFASILITIGGTFSATFASFPFKNFKDIGKHIFIALKKPKHDHNYYINLILELAVEARRNGILSLEEKAMEIKDKFLSDCIMLIVDALPADRTKELIQTKIDNIETRHAAVWKMYEKAATYAPAFGMIGTLIGLINMLANIDMDAQTGSASLTKGMATALLTTLYGSLLSNLVFMPISNKLRSRNDEEVLSKLIIAEGVLAIQAGDNPRFIEQKLHAFLDNYQRNKKTRKKTRKKEKKTAVSQIN